MPDESGPSPAKESKNETTPGRDSKQVNGARPGPSKGWARSDRIRLFIWAGIAFSPLALMLGLHLGGSRNPAVLTVQSELPIKAITAFSVFLATWVVSRMEKRPLADYGIPPAQAFGRRFWEGSVWGFVMLSAILLVLWSSGHFQIDSVELAGGAVFALYWRWLKKNKIGPPRS